MVLQKRQNVIRRSRNQRGCFTKSRDRGEEYKNQKQGTDQVYRTCYKEGSLRRIDTDWTNKWREK